MTDNVFQLINEIKELKEKIANLKETLVSDIYFEDDDYITSCEKKDNQDATKEVLDEMCNLYETLVRLEVEFALLGV